jgi:hypothetical protein
VGDLHEEGAAAAEEENALGVDATDYGVMREEGLFVVRCGGVQAM